MSSATLPATTVKEIEQATHTLARLVAFLRANPPVDDAQVLLEPLFDDDKGAPVLLSEILWATARLVSGQVAVPWTDETKRILRTLAAASQEFRAWHVLDWDIPYLDSLDYDPYAAAPHRMPRRLVP